MEMSEQQREWALQQQQSCCFHGIVTYEGGGLGTSTEISGMINATASGFIVFGDPAALMIEQGRTYIPEHRVIRVEFDA